MFNVGDLLIYSAHGICQIDDVQERTYFDITKKYYTLHPVEDEKLQISVPVDSEKVLMLELLTKEKAEDILESFKEPGIEWIEMDGQRNQTYSKIIKGGDRKEIAKIVNTLIKHRREMENEGRKFHESDKKILTSVENILFTELAYSLNTTVEEINKKVNNLIGTSKPQSL